MEQADLKVRRGADESRSRKFEWVISLLLLAYPLLGTLVAFTSLPSLVASVPVRTLILFLSFYLLASSDRAVAATGAAKLIIVFFCAYSIRLLWDWSVADIPVAVEYGVKFLVFCVPTALAFLHCQKLDEPRLARNLLVVGSVVCILAMVAYDTNITGVRSTTEEAEGRLFLDTVNPITFGHVGVTTILAGVAVLRFSKGLLGWTAAGAAITLGFIALQMAGSRGPLISLLICLFAAAALAKSQRWLVIPLVVGAIFLFINAADDTQNLLAARLIATVSGGDAEERVLLAQGAAAQFFDSPLLGSAIVEKTLGIFPHNPFLESAMAIGVLGLLFFCVINVIAIAKIASALRSGEILVPLLAVQAITAAQVSGSLFESASMWMFLALFVGRVKTPKGRQTSNSLSLRPLAKAEI